MASRAGGASARAKRPGDPRRQRATPAAVPGWTRPPPRPAMTVVYLDPYFLGDPLFVPGLARDLAARAGGLVLVHGSGERGERALESLGRVPRAVDGVWGTDDEAGRAAVERATRELNREVAHELNEQGVSSIRALAADRGLVKVSGGRVEAGRAAWLGDLVRQGVTAVVASLVLQDGALVEVDAAATAAALAAALGGDAFALSTRSVEAPLDARQLDGVVPEPQAVRRLVAGGGAVRVGPRSLLRSPGGLSSSVLVA